jgi:hypothetical protein
MIEDSKQNLSALDKVKQMKAQKEQERKEAEELIKKQEQEKIQSAETMYTKLQNDLADLELQKKDLESQMKDQKREKVSIRKSQEAATAEIFSDKDVVEEVFQGEGKIKDNQTLKDIFAEDEEKVSSIDKTIKELKDQIKATEESIEITKLQAQEIHKQTPKGIEEIEKQKAEQEAAEKAVQEKIKKEERIKINQVLGVNVKNQSNEFFKTGQLSIDEDRLKKTTNEFGVEKVKTAFDQQFTEQIKDVVNNERNKWGVNQLKEGVEKYDIAKQEYNRYKKDYVATVKKLAQEYAKTIELSKEITTLIPQVTLKEIGNNLDKKIGISSYLDQLESGYGTMTTQSNRSVLDLDLVEQKIISLEKTNELLADLLVQSKEHPDFEQFKTNWNSADFGPKISLDTKTVFDPDVSGADKVTFRAFDQDRYQQLGYQGLNEYDRDRQSRIEKTVSMDQARQLLAEGEVKVAAKEKVMKEVADAQFDQMQLIIETRSTFPDVSRTHISDLENQYANYTYHQKKLIEMQTEMLKKSTDLEKNSHEHVSLYNGSIIFTDFLEKNNTATIEIESTEKTIQKLQIERQTLESENARATFGFGNGKRSERIASIDREIAEHKQRVETLQTEKRNRPVYLNVDYIIDELRLDKREVMFGVITAGDLIKKINESIEEDRKIPFDPKKKEYIEKLKKAQSIVDQKKSEMVSVMKK